jgi:hypothetical protein
MQRLLRLFALAFACLFFANPAWAIDGRTAVGMCIDSTASGARCSWAVNDKGEIDICNKNGCVTCPSATEECTVAMKRPRPSTSLPEGVVVSTQLGDFKVKGCNRIDELIKPKVIKKPR